MRRPAFAFAHREGGLVYKYMVWPPTFFGPATERLYELTTDPHETRDLIGSVSAERLSLLRARLSQGFGPNPSS